jgi:hypothetical protein
MQIASSHVNNSEEMKEGNYCSCIRIVITIFLGFRFSRNCFFESHIFLQSLSILHNNIFLYNIIFFHGLDFLYMFYFLHGVSYFEFLCCRYNYSYGPKDKINNLLVLIE